jgi:hypothetical protein
MDGRDGSIVILIASAYLGGAVAFAACWPHGFLLAVAAAPIGGSLAALVVALLLYRRRAALRNRPLTGIRSVPPGAAGSGWRAR